jgi:hypothetical protein
MPMLLYVALGVSIASLVATIFTFATLWFGVIAAMKEQIARLVTKEEVTWAVIAPHLANIIHQPTHFRRDFLMDELEQGKLNNKPKELQELNHHLDVMIQEAIVDKDDMRQIIGALSKAHVQRLLLDLQPRKRTWFMRLFQ